MTKIQKLLMLDKDDITIVCGTITSREAKKELKLTDNQFAKFIDMGKLFRGKYILIEEYGDEWGDLDGSVKHI